MQPPPTTTTSAVSGRRADPTGSRIECILIVLSFAAFLFSLQYRYQTANDNPLSPGTSDGARVPDTWRLGVGEERARVAIVGCGGAGCNVLRRVAAPPNATRIAVNDTVHPSMAEVSTRVLVAAGSLQAYASMDEKAVPNMETDEVKQISASLLDRDIVVMLGRLGGELGGWGVSLVGRVARIVGDASGGLAPVPFTVEGPIRRQLAEAQLRLLQKRPDGVVTFRNDRLLPLAGAPPR